MTGSTCETLHHVQGVVLSERRCTPGQPWRPEDAAELDAWKMVAHEYASPVPGDETGAYRCPVCETTFVPAPC